MSGFLGLKPTNGRDKLIESGDFILKGKLFESILAELAVLASLCTCCILVTPDFVAQSKLPLVL